MTSIAITRWRTSVGMAAVAFMEASYTLMFATAKSGYSTTDKLPGCRGADAGRSTQARYRSGISSSRFAQTYRVCSGIKASLMAAKLQFEQWQPHIPRLATRREFLFKAGAGFGALALTALLTEEA